jgi:tetratricopeptide (TPR) repeat protein
LESLLAHDQASSDFLSAPVQGLARGIDIERLTPAPARPEKRPVGWRLIAAIVLACSAAVGFAWWNRNTSARLQAELLRNEIRALRPPIGASRTAALVERLRRLPARPDTKADLAAANLALSELEYSLYGDSLGDLDAAIASLARAEAHGSGPELRIRQSELAQEQGRFEESLARALEARRGVEPLIRKGGGEHHLLAGRAFLQSGRVYYETGRNAEAIPMLERAVALTRLSGADVQLAHSLLWLAQAQRNPAPAAEARGLLRKSGSHPRADLLARWILWELDAGESDPQPQQAASGQDPRLEVESGRWAVALGAAALRRGAMEEARAQLQPAAAHSSRIMSRHPRLYRARVLAAQSLTWWALYCLRARPDEAETAARRARQMRSAVLRINPGDPEIARLPRL